MPRIVPLQLLKCLKVLLDDNGGILSEGEVRRIAGLMTKYSKKLVSKCIYVQILKCTKTELLGEFMGAGGWTLVHMWLNDAIRAMNWPLVQEILELLLLCPVDVDRLKSNSAPKLVRGLCKDGGIEGVRILAKRLVEQWLKVVTADSSVIVSNATTAVQPNAANTMPPQVTNYETPKAPVAAAMTPTTAEAAATKAKTTTQIRQNNATPARAQKESVGNETASDVEEDEEQDPLADVPSDVPIAPSYVPTPAQKKASEAGLVYKIVVKDGQQVLTKVDAPQQTAATTPATATPAAAAATTTSFVSPTAKRPQAQAVEAPVEKPSKDSEEEEEEEDEEGEEDEEEEEEQSKESDEAEAEVDEENEDDVSRQKEESSEDEEEEEEEKKVKKHQSKAQVESKTPTKLPTKRIQPKVIIKQLPQDFRKMNKMLDIKAPSEAAEKESVGKKIAASPEPKPKASPEPKKEKERDEKDALEEVGKTKEPKENKEVKLERKTSKDSKDGKDGKDKEKDKERGEKDKERKSEKDKERKSSSSSSSHKSSSHKSSSKSSSSSSSSSAASPSLNKIKSSSSSSSSSSEKRSSVDKPPRSDKDKERSSSSSSSSKDKDRNGSSSGSHSKSSKSSSSSSSSSSKPSSSSSSSSKESSSKERSRDKEKEKDKSSSSSTSSSSMTKKEKENIQAEKDKETLATMSKHQLPSIDKLGKIPKKPKVDGDSEDSSKQPMVTSISIPSKKTSMSIEIRRDTEKTKTVKTYKSQFRSHGLTEEAPPPPSRKGLKKPSSVATPGTSIPSSLPSSLKRTSPPPRDSPTEKKAKIDINNVSNVATEKPGAIKLIAPKKIAHLVETNLFSDALSAATGPKKTTKRKRPVTPKEGPSPPTSPETLKVTPLKFYQDTLDESHKEEDKDASTAAAAAAGETKSDATAATESKDDATDKDSVIEDDDDIPLKKVKEDIEQQVLKEKKAAAGEIDEIEEKSAEDTIATEIQELESDEPAEPKKPGPGCGPNGPPGVLSLHRRKGPKKKLSWRPQEQLEQIRYFELDETERVNVTKTFMDMKNMERFSERDAINMSRRGFNHEDNMEPQTAWKPLILIDDVPPHPEGSQSKERKVQSDREQTTLRALYFSHSMIPDSPTEAEFEPHYAYDIPVIPLDDITGNPDAVNDFTSMPWPDPKGSPKHGDSSQSGDIFAANFNPFINPFGGAMSLAAQQQQQQAELLQQQQQQQQIQQQQMPSPTAVALQMSLGNAPPPGIWPGPNGRLPGVLPMAALAGNQFNGPPPGSPDIMGGMGPGLPMGPPPNFMPGRNQFIPNGPPPPNPFGPPGGPPFSGPPPGFNGPNNFIPPPGMGPGPMMNGMGGGPGGVPPLLGNGGGGMGGPNMMNGPGGNRGGNNNNNNHNNHNNHNNNNRGGGGGGGNGGNWRSNGPNFSDNNNGGGGGGGGNWRPNGPNNGPNNNRNDWTSGNNNPNTGICKAYMRGHCRLGKSCKYVHPKKKRI